jgi:hypothetical protein
MIGAFFVDTVKNRLQGYSGYTFQNIAAISLT